MIRPATLQRSVIAFLAAALALGLGCGKKEPSAGAQTAAAGGTDDSQIVYDKLGRAPDTYVRYFPANPDNLNPIIQRDVYSDYLLSYIFDPLYDYDTQNNYVLKPLLASALPTISEDKKTFTIPIRKDAKWHDGHPVTAHDMVFGYQMVVNPEVDSAQKKSYYADVEYFKAIDDYTLEIRMKKAYAFYANLLNMKSIVPKHLFEGVTPAQFNNFKYPAGHKLAGTAYSINPLGYGAYSVERFEPQKEIILVRNDDYWGPKPEVKRIHVLILTDTLASRQFLKRGDLDAFNYNVTRQWKMEDQNDAYIKRNFNLTLYYRAVYYYIGWNLQKEMFKDKRVRVALAKLCDIDAFINQVELGYATRCIGPYSKEFAQADPAIKPIAFDPKGAASLLDEAGWKDTDGDGIRDKGGQKFEFQFLMPSKNPRGESLSTLLQEELKKAGIRMTIRALEWNAFSEEIHNQKFDALFSGWASSDPEDDSFQIFHSSQSKERGSNYVTYANPKVDELIEKARVEFDQAKRNELCHEINRLIYDDQPYCFLFHPQLISVIHKRFKTGKPSPLMGYDPRAGYDFKIVGRER
jgi:peptide/nickel transport system substrate-binding protein